jgi:sulfite reductase (NADPH) hemoprotein beta-component
VAVGADGVPTPLHYREKMRIKGPSVRLDLGKQAAGGAQ